MLGKPWPMDDRGAIAVLFALLLPVLVVLLGGALDYSRALEARTRLRSAAQSALSHLISGIRGGKVRNRHQLASLFTARIRAEHKRRLRAEGLELRSAHVALARGALVAKVKARVRTPFLGIIGIRWIPVEVVEKSRINFAAIAASHRLRITCHMLERRFRNNHELQNFILRLKERGVDPDRLRRFENLLDTCRDDL